MAKNRRADEKFKGNLKNYDLAATGAGSKKGTERLSKRDVKDLMASGKSAKKLQNYGESLDRDEGQIFGASAQRFLNKKMSEVSQKPDTTPEQVVEDETRTTQPSPPVNQSPGVSNPQTPTQTTTEPAAPTPSITETEPVDAQDFANERIAAVASGTRSAAASPGAVTGDTDQTMDVGSKASATNTGDVTMGGSNYGRVNTGTQDYSINFGGNQNVGGTGTGAGASDGGYDMNANFKTVAKGQALNENLYQRSQNEFDSRAYAVSNSKLADELTGTSDRVKGLNDAVNKSVTHWTDYADATNLGVFGDIYNMEAPEWKPPGDLSEIETTYDKDDDDDN